MLYSDQVRLDGGTHQPEIHSIIWKLGGAILLKRFDSFILVAMSASFKIWWNSWFHTLVDQRAWMASFLKKMARLELFGLLPKTSVTVFIISWFWPKLFKFFFWVLYRIVSKICLFWSYKSSPIANPPFYSVAVKINLSYFLWIGWLAWK